MHIVLPVELYYLVYEKERSLRIYQYLQGLSPATYHAAAWSTHLLIYSLTMGTFVSLGYAFGIKMMVLNSFSVQLVFWTLWGSVVTSFALCASRLFKEKRSVILLSLFYVLVSGFIANVFLVLFVEQDMHGVVLLLQSLLPSFAAFRGLYELSSYAFLADQTNGKGMQWSTFGTDPGMLVVLIQLAVQSLVLPLLALFLERERRAWRRREGANAKAAEAGRLRKKKDRDDAIDLYLGYLNGGGSQFDSNDVSAATSPDAAVVPRRDSSMGYYFGRGGGGGDGGGGDGGGGGGGGGRGASGGMAARGSRTAGGGGNEHLPDQDYDGPSVVFHGVRKAQPNAPAIYIPCLAVHDREIFCFLAEDANTASCLLKMVQGGLSRQDDGAILVRGQDSRELVGELRTRIAIVFNVDILFEDLTGHEHLSYYVRTRLARVNDADADRYVQNAVDILELHSVIHKTVSTYSSGMRRRLSLAIALLGYPDRDRLPQVLLIHEPTRSMDPYSRRVLWRALGDLRQKTAIIIATGSVSEAEVGIIMIIRVVSCGSRGSARARARALTHPPAPSLAPWLPHSLALCTFSSPPVRPVTGSPS